jgi:hypothetical protein
MTAPRDWEHRALTDTGEVCAAENMYGESTADLSEVPEQPVVPDGS